MENGNNWQIHSHARRKTLNGFQALRQSKIYILIFQAGTGKISANEVKEVLGVGKKIACEDIWQEIVKDVDIDGDGAVSYEEFRVMMTKFLNNESTRSQISQISISNGGGASLKSFKT